MLDDYEVYIRPLRREDAEVSYKWRNNPKIWEMTGSKPDREVTLKMELEWIDRVLQESNSRRFAICLSSTRQYIVCKE